MSPPSGSGGPGAASTGPTIDWQTTLAKHRRWLGTVIGARLRHPEAVEEVFQEVALAAARGQASLRDPAKVAPWLYRLAILQCLLYRRRQGRHRRLMDRFAGHLRPSEADAGQPDPLGWLLADERRQLVRQAIARLPRRDAEILLLKYGEDWSYRQLAEHLGLSLSAVQARLHRARGRLRSELAALKLDEP